MQTAIPPLPPKLPRIWGILKHGYLAWLYVLIRDDHKAIKIGYAGDLPRRLTETNRLRKRQGKRQAIMLYAVGMTGEQVFAAEAEIKELLADHRNGDGVELLHFSGHVLQTIKDVIRRYDPHYKPHLYRAPSAQQKPYRLPAPNQRIA